jgi:CTP:molybdopterin cytidylyltransferase MocA
MDYEAGAGTLMARATARYNSSTDTMVIRFNDRPWVAEPTSARHRWLLRDRDSGAVCGLMIEDFGMLFSSGSDVFERPWR